MPLWPDLIDDDALLIYLVAQIQLWPDVFRRPFSRQKIFHCFDHIHRFENIKCHTGSVVSAGEKRGQHFYDKPGYSVTKLSFILKYT